jgi:hypothetical protein
VTAQSGPNTKWEVAPDRDVEGDWRVEGIGDDGECYIAIFAGPCAEERAKSYHGWLVHHGA